MPTYEYVCLACGEHVEVFQAFSDEPLSVCPICGGQLRKVFHPAGILFKGSGFYKTDNRTKARSSASGDGGSASAGSAGSGSKGSKGSKGSSESGSSGGSGGSGESGGSGDSAGSGGSGGPGESKQPAPAGGSKGQD
ncbi:MAG: FmdB family zinc ribbon protein [Actinomycetota bacterium]